MDRRIPMEDTFYILATDSTADEVNRLFVVNLTNADVYQAGQIVLPRGVLHITRMKLLRQGTCYENLTFINYGLSPVEVKFSMDFGTDVADVYEVLGMTRRRKGVRH